MSSGNNLHLHFVAENHFFDIDFQLQKKRSSETVSIDGRNYVLCGDEFSITWLKTKLPELTGCGLTRQELKKRLKRLKATELDVESRTDSVAVAKLGTFIPKNKSSWVSKNKTVANKYWEINATRFLEIAKTVKHIEHLKKDASFSVDEQEKVLSELRKPDVRLLRFLKDSSSNPSRVEQNFFAAVKQNDLSLFQTLFQNLTADQLLSIDSGEKLNVISPTLLSNHPVTITKSDLANLREHMRDINFSGAVALSDGTDTYTVSSDNLLDPQVPFSIHSIGKVFTGVLALRMIEEGMISVKVLDQPIQLKPEVIAKLKPKVREQLKHTTLRAVMLHHGRYGDYLGNYQNAIETALKENKSPPTVDSPEDLLRFADKDLAKPDSAGYAYSNLGLLLVGLSLQHLYNSQHDEQMTYDELLRDYVLEPAGVQVYKRHKPSKARVNSEDKVASYIAGGPAGGAWSTVGDLARFGDWLGAKCEDSNSPFFQLIEEFGGEFFSHREIAHGGSIESASAHLSHRLDNGVTLSVVSDMTGLGVASNLAQVIQENILKQTPLERAVEGLESRLQETCPKGAGSIVMVSSPEEGVRCASAGTRTVKGGKIDNQTAALIGSGAKLFTALCSLALISRGAQDSKAMPQPPLTLKTKVSDVFSTTQMKIFDDQKKAKKLTLEMLLSHTSGLVYFADDMRDDRKGKSLSEILNEKEPGSVKFYGHPGDRIYSYSNHIGLAAAMIEIACGKPYAKVLQEVLLAPLGMDRTSYDCPKDDNVLLAYRLPDPGKEKGFPISEKQEITDPMMQGAGGLWSCMDDMAKLGSALGKALSKKGDLINNNDQVVIGRKYLKSMISSHAINAPCGLAVVLEGDVVGKGGGVYGYDFKFKVNAKSGSSVSMMCNHAGKGDFNRYLETASTLLRALNPEISLPSPSKPPPKAEEVTNLSINECPIQFKGFSGSLAFPNLDKQPLTRINFNGTTLPVEQLSIEGTSLADRYLITGDSPFQGMELQIFKRKQHMYACFSNGLDEVWSFAKIEGAKFSEISTEEIVKRWAGAAGEYKDTGPEGPDLYMVGVDSERGLTLSHSDIPPSKCLVTAASGTEISFTVSLGGGPQPISYKLDKKKHSDGWILTVLNGETKDPISEALQTEIKL